MMGGWSLLCNRAIQWLVDVMYVVHPEPTTGASYLVHSAHRTMYHCIYTTRPVKCVAANGERGLDVRNVVLPYSPSTLVVQPD